MLSVDEALSAVIGHAAPIDIETTPLATALGRALAEDVTSTIDSPPFDKSMMDGFALRAGDIVGGSQTLSVIETIMAGQVPTRKVGPGQTTRIMTGAPIPAGADAVVPVERTTLVPPSDAVQINVALRAGANILRRGESMTAGERVYAAGHVLRAQDLGVLAELGVANVSVRRRPRVAILATGDELVPPGERPGAGQIRNSNESLLVGLVAAAGGEPVPLGIARDVKEELRTKIDEGLRCDVLILSGGVSAGALDLVPAVLKEAGVEQVFHKVNVKPGKPVWFGAGGGERSAESGERRAKGKKQRANDEESESQTPSTPSHLTLRSTPFALRPVPLVFGLPGNPVSVLVCFELFAKTAIRGLLGIDPPGPRSVPATLMAAFENRGDRPTYHPARITVAAEGRLTVTPVRWAGSGDLRATADANGVAVFEPNGSYPAGAVINALLWPGAVSEGANE